MKYIDFIKFKTLCKTLCATSLKIAYKMLWIKLLDEQDSSILNLKN